MRNNNYFILRKIFIYLSLFIITNFLCLRLFKKTTIQDIEIVGTNLISKKNLINNSSLKFPSRLIYINTKYLEEELKQNLSLKNISINRNLIPFGLKIYIETREPIALGEKLNKDKIIKGYIDKEGFFIHEKFASIGENKELNIKITGWNKNYRHAISKILKAQEKFENDLISIKIAPSGFLTLKDKSLKNIKLGSDLTKIETQLSLISDIKNQLIKRDVIKKIESLDLSDPNNPIIKVFKP